MAAAAANMGPPPDPPDIPKKTFASIVAGEKKNNHIDAKLPTTFKGEPAIFFTDEEVSILAEPFKFALVGKFIKGRPNMIAIRNFFAKLNLRADYKIGLMDSKHILIHLQNEEDYHRIWLRSQWNIFQYPMVITKWHVNYTPENESPIVPVWISMPYLPPHLFREDALLSIARTIGIPMRTDTSTATLARPSKARVCVEVDVSKPLPKRSYIGQGKNGFWQNFLYENVPMYCEECKKIGHETGKCIMAVEEKQEAKGKTQGIITEKPHENNAQNKAAKENKQKNKQQFIYVQRNKGEPSKKNAGDDDMRGQPEKDQKEVSEQNNIINLEKEDKNEEVINQKGEDNSTQGVEVHNMFDTLIEEVEVETEDEETENEVNMVINDNDVQYTILKRGESLENFQKANSIGTIIPKVLAGNVHFSDNDTPEDEDPSIEDLKIFSERLNMPDIKTTENIEMETNIIQNIRETPDHQKKKKKHQKNPEHQRNTRAAAKGSQTKNKNKSR